MEKKASKNVHKVLTTVGITSAVLGASSYATAHADSTPSVNNQSAQVNTQTDIKITQDDIEKAQDVVTQAQFDTNNAQATVNNDNSQITVQQSKVADDQLALNKIQSINDTQGDLASVQKQLQDDQNQLAHMQVQKVIDEDVFAKAQHSLTDAQANLTRLKNQYAAEQAAQQAEADQAQAVLDNQIKYKIDVNKISSDDNSVYGLSNNGDGSYTIFTNQGNLISDKNGMIFSINEVKVPFGEYYVNEKGEIIDTNHKFLKPSVAIRQVKKQKIKAKISQFIKSKNKSKALPNTGESKSSGLMSAIGGFLVGLAGLFSLRTYQKNN